MNRVLRIENPLTEIVSGDAACLTEKLLSEIGVHGFEVKRDTEGAPIWPAGVCGSISNIKKKKMFTAVSLSRKLVSLGIDIELLSRGENAYRARSLFLPERLDVSSLEALLCFSAKEAAYKAIYPIIKKRFWFSAVKVVEITDKHIHLKPESLLNEAGFSESLSVEYKILDEICFTMLKIP